MPVRSELSDGRRCTADMCSQQQKPLYKVHLDLSSLALLLVSQTEADWLQQHNASRYLGVPEAALHLMPVVEH